ncbi:MAG: efflux RND transporter periplasmic adaptor subunit [Deltaproteobacteria bacterium]|nr:efflux RND transporter periplasmic adaptor subunit [Deltaproteobacteria bacterium]
MGNKKIVLSLALVSLLLVAFWLGRVTGRVGKSGETSHEKIPVAPTKSHDEAAPHAHEDGKADGHDEGKEATAGLKLSAEEKANIGLKTVVADLRPIENVIRISGTVRPHPDKEAQVSSRVSGKIAALFFKVGDPVQRGQRLAEIQSAEIQKLQVDLIQAENKLVLHKAELDRIQRLVESKIAAQKELIAAQNQYQTALNEIDGLTQQLILLGLPEHAVKKARAEKSISTFAILSPLNGVVAERGVVLGETVEPNKVMFKIFDPAVVFVEGDAFEEAAPQLKVGQQVRIRLTAYPGEVFTGKIARFSPVIDPQKRTIHLWVEVANRGGILKPNLFADMDAVVGGRQEVLAIPAEAIITTEGASFVFVEEKGEYRRADVVLGARDDRFAEVKSGLLPGDRVVTLGKQQIYTKSLMARGGGAALGGHGH